MTPEITPFDVLSKYNEVVPKPTPSQPPPSYSETRKLTMFFKWLDGVIRGENGQNKIEKLSLLPDEVKGRYIVFKNNNALREEYLNKIFELLNQGGDLFRDLVSHLRILDIDDERFVDFFLKKLKSEIDFLSAVQQDENNSPTKILQRVFSDADLEVSFKVIKSDVSPIVWNLLKGLEYVGIQNVKAIHFLSGLLANKSLDKKAKIEIARTLGTIVPENKNATNFLLSVINKSEDIGTLVKATYALRRVSPGNKDAISPLENKLNTQMPSGALAEALGYLNPGNDKVVSYYIIRLNDSDLIVDPIEFSNTIYSFKPVAGENERAIDFIAKVDLADHPRIAYFVADFLESTRPEIAVKAYRKSLEYPNDNIFLHAARGLKRLGQAAEANEALNYLKQQLYKRSDDEIQHTAESEKALVNIATAICIFDPGNKQAISTLSNIIDNGAINPAEVASYLGYIDPGNEKAIDLLLSKINYDDPDDTTTLKYIEMGGVGSETAIDSLIGILTDKKQNEYLRYWVGKTLITIGTGNEKVKNAFCEVLSDPSEPISRVAIKGLREIAIKDTNVIRRLLDVLIRNSEGTNFTPKRISDASESLSMLLAT